MTEQRAADAAATELRRHVHPEHAGLVPVLLARLAREPDHARERTIEEGTEDHVAAVRRDPRLGRGQRSGGLGVVTRGKRVGMLGEAPQPQRTIRGGVGRGEPSYDDVR